MKAAVVAACLLGAAEAINLKRSDAPAVVLHKFERKHVHDPVTRDMLRKRAKTVGETLDNFEDGSLYFANVTIGTPAQNFRFHIDTGSSDLWTNAASSSLCESGNNPSDGDIPCSVSGTYNANASSTYAYVNSEFVISYADGTGASGDYVTDTLRIGGADITKLQMGVGYQSTSSEGVMGIGYPALEVQAQNNFQTPYANIPQAMTSQGLINSPAYSLWLDDLASATGSILFGGVDTAKFTGDLVSLPIVPEQGVYLEMIVQLNGVNMVSSTTNSTVSTGSTPVLLDSGSTLSYLPIAVAEQIYSTLGVTWSNHEQQAFCSCSLAKSTTTLEFIFAGQVIPVQLSEMVLQGGISDSLDCTFGIFEQADDTTVGTSYTLGDTFIRNAYIVYDLHNNEISMAPTNFSPSGSAIQEIQASGNAIAGATAATTGQASVTTTTSSPSATAAASSNVDFSNVSASAGGGGGGGNGGDGSGASTSTSPAVQSSAGAQLTSTVVVVTTLASSTAGVSSSATATAGTNSSAASSSTSWNGLLAGLALGAGVVLAVL